VKRAIVIVVLLLIVVGALASGSKKGAQTVTATSPPPASVATGPAAQAKPRQAASVTHCDQNIPVGAHTCNEHTCIGSFETESGTIVECSDGTYSHAGGISGACSHHGGEAGKE
jgi:uncharacterized protein YdeI (BOF family)